MGDWKISKKRLLLRGFSLVMIKGAYIILLVSGK